MTPVVFHFLTPDGQPLAGAEIEIQLTKSAHDDLVSGVLMPRLVTAVTDENGEARVSLMATPELYYVSVYDTESDAVVAHKFYVPDLEPGVTEVRLQDIIVQGTLSGTPWDDAAIQLLHEAKANAVSAMVSAQTAEANAKDSELQAVAAANSATAAETTALATLPVESAVPPATPLDGQGWINSDTGRRYTWLALQGVWAEVSANLTVDNPGLVDALRDEYAAPTGAAQVGAMQAGAGAVARTVQDKLRETVSVKDFGAVGDGATDDTAAIQAAINVAQSGTFDRDVIMPIGKYRVTAKLVVGEARNILFKGEAGPFTGTQIYVDFNGNVFESDVAQTWSMENVQIAGNLATHPLCGGIDISSTGGSAQVYMNFRNVTLNNLGKGIRLSNAFACRFEGVKLASIKGRALDIQGGSSSQFSGLTIEQCDGDGMYINGAGHTLDTIHLENNCKAGGGARELIIAGNSIVIMGGTIAPVAGNTTPPVLVTGNNLFVNGVKGYALPASHWIEVSGTYAGLVQVGSLSCTGNLDNVVQIIAGVPGSSTSDVTIGGVSLLAGAIVSQGSNANGKWVRFADGRQECTAAGGLFYAASGTNYDRTWTFPMAFVDTKATVSAHSGAADPAYRPNAVARVKAVTSTTAVLNFSDNDIGYNATARGYWK